MSKTKNVLIDFIKKYKIELIIFFLIIIAHESLALNFKALVQIIGYDEPATLSWTGLFMSDVSWQEVIAQHKYYGFGFSAFFALIYGLFDNPVVIYQIMQFVVAVLYAVAGIISYKIIGELSSLESRKQKFVAAFFAIASVFVPVKFTYVMNEHVYILINWILVYLLLKLIRGQGNKIYYTIFCVVVLCYALTIHEKAITIWVGFFVTVIACSILFKKCVVNYIVALITGGLGYGILKKIISRLRGFMWVEKTVVQNTADATISTTLSKLSYLSQPANWIFPIVTFASQLFFMSMSTGGLFLVSACMGIFLVWKTVRKPRVSEMWERQASAIVIYSFICIGITIIMQCISWMPNVADYSSEQVMEEIWGKRAKLYLRYFCCYCGPLIALFSVYINRYYEKMKKVMKVSVVVYFVISVFIAVAISPWYANFQLGESPVYTMFIPFTLKSSNAYLTRGTFITALIVAGILMLIIMFLYSKRYLKVLSIFIAVLFIYQYVLTGLVVYKNGSEQIYNENYPVYEVLNDIEDQLNGVVYMPDLKKPDIRLKFYLTKFSIAHSFPDLFGEKNVIIYSKDGVVNEDMLTHNYNLIEAGAYEIYLSPDIYY